jgi:glucoamylase
MKLTAASISLLLTSFLFFPNVLAETQRMTQSSTQDPDFEQWLRWEYQNAAIKMFQNISPDDLPPGIVIASPERQAPPYYYQWVRDAALTMDTAVSLYNQMQGSDRLYIEKQLLGYVRFSRNLQKTSTRDGLGFPLFFVDGRPYDRDWCSPQNDGPALRALTLIHFAHSLIGQNRGDFVRRELYDGKIPTESVIKADLEYVSHHWNEKNCDLWEETWGHHFYTRMVQRRALLEGAQLATQLGDSGAAFWYVSQARSLESSIAQHWDGSRQIILAHLEGEGNTQSKKQGLDSAVILGVLHGATHDGFFPAVDQKVFSTYEKLVQAFQYEYKINQVPQFPGVAIGRYPGDIYGGTHFNHGNPWVLTTLAFANYNYQLADFFLQSNDFQRARALVSTGDLFLKRVRLHAHPDGSLSEQIDRNTGYMTSARDLTWNYSEFLQALWARSKVSIAPKISLDKKLK